MTNKAIKNYHKNKLVIDAANDTLNIMCVFLLTAHKLFPKVMYPKAVRRFADDRTEYCRVADADDQDDVFDYKMKRACDELGINDSDCARIVKKYMHPINMQINEVFINNVKLLLVQLHNEHGIGQARRERLIAALLSDEAETERPLERINAMGVDIDMTAGSTVDYTKYKRKPTKTTYQEQQEARQGLQWLREYQNSVLNNT